MVHKKQKHRKHFMSGRQGIQIDIQHYTMKYRKGIHCSRSPFPSADQPPSRLSHSLKTAALVQLQVCAYLYPLFGNRASESSRSWCIRQQRFLGMSVGACHVTKSLKCRSEKMQSSRYVCTGQQRCRGMLMKPATTKNHHRTCSRKC